MTDPEDESKPVSWDKWVKSFDDFMKECGIKPFHLPDFDKEGDVIVRDLEARFKDEARDDEQRSPCPQCGLKRMGGGLASAMRQCFYCKYFGCAMCIGVHIHNIHQKPSNSFSFVARFADQYPDYFNVDKTCKECGKDGKTLFFELKKIDPETGLCNDCLFVERNK